MKPILINFSIVFYCCMFFSGLNAQNQINVSNPGFESVSGWNNLNRSNDGYYSPVDGEYVAFQNGNASWISQETSEIIQEGKTYSFTAYARSVNAAQRVYDTHIEVELYSGGTVLSSHNQNVSIPRLQGDAAQTPQDDGANIWIDGNYRMSFNDVIMYQTLSDDPILDPWYIYNDPEWDADMALGQVITPNFKGVYSTYYTESPFFSEMTMMTATGSPPNYDWGTYSKVLNHQGDEEPWCIDAHLYYDDETGRLWMSWGGHKLWVTEMDPVTGKIKGNPSDFEFNNHPGSTHTQVAHFNIADQWSDGYMEGPCLFKRNGYWYLFGSWGNMGTNYTIRMGRSTSPTGPFYDKNGVDLNNNGGTLLFGDEGEQCVPGHPHIWEENGQHYLGYDFRTDKRESPDDYMAIRKLYWDNDWPTIYQPVNVSFTVPSGHPAIGQPLSIRFRSASSHNHARLAVDKVSLTSDGGVSTTYTLTTSATTGGVVTPGGTYDSGTVVSITATPNSGYQFDDWSGDASGTTNPLSVAMNSDLSVIANFSSTNVGTSFPTNAKIMPLGASRTEGERPVFESHRYELWKNMLDNGWTFDYIGNQYDNASYPTYLGQAFDGDHEGHGGFVSEEILLNVNNWITTAGVPDIVFYGAPGGNDALQDLPISNTLANINSIIDEIQSNNPNVTIFIEQLAPAHSSIMTATLTDYINQLVAEIPVIADQQTTATSKVIPVDINTGWMDSYFADDVHYNEAGAKEAADRYIAVMNTFYSSDSTTTYTLTTSATLGGSVTPGGTYDSGTVVSITATPDADYQFDGWSGDATGTTNPLNVTMDADKSITANFSEIPSGSWITVDNANTSIIYSGIWAFYDDVSGCIQNTHGEVASSGASAYLAFSGTQARVYIFGESGAGTADVIIDGNNVGTIDFGSFDGCNQLAFTSSTLSDGNHYIEIVQTSGIIFLDAFEYYGSGSGARLADITSSEMKDNSTDFVIYPNPAYGDFMNIRLKKFSGETQITISDLTGKLMLSEMFKVPGDNDDIEIDISELKSGFYNVNVKSNLGDTYNKIFIK